MGLPDGGGVESCPAQPWAPPRAGTHGTCSADFSVCIDRATTTEENAACYEAESGECSECLIGSLYHCAGEAGCDQDYGNLECCLDDACPSADADCEDRALTAGGACAAADAAVLSCMQARIDDRSCAYIAAECIEGGGDGGDGSVSGGACSGRASVSGSAGGAPVRARYAYAHNDAGGIGVFMMDVPFASATVGTRALAARLSPVAGQVNYPPTSSLFQCGIVELTGSGWRGVSNGLCEMNLASLVYASAAGVCDGRFAGTFRAIFGTDAIAGTFDAPLPMAESELSGPSCLPRDARCSSHADCCARSCSPAIGVCQ